MSKNPNPPSIASSSFDCPYCGAYSQQSWHSLLAGRIENAEQWKSIINNIIDKDIVTVVHRENLSYATEHVNNLFLSQCYNCKRAAVWFGKRLIFPQECYGVGPNDDLPKNIIEDFEEARTIVSLSPRGAAALMRLALQKLCKHLGEKGKNIDEDIASLVSKGLNPLVRDMLDIVRVVGNEAVHPGVLDLKDDKDTVITLFGLVNSIADQMISHPKSVKESYNKLPQDKRDAIEARNKRATGGTET